jgi:Ca2+-binding RTX toxin-like protein
MAIYYGTQQRDVFLLGHHKTGDTVVADGVSGPSGPSVDFTTTNFIYAGKGDDTLTGGYGRDTIFGNKGDDVISGSGGGYAGSPSGYGSITKRDGADYLDGGAGNDIIYGHGGDDTIVGGSGDDVIYGGSGHNTVYGGSGNDVIRSAGDVWGGSGRDTFAYVFTGSPSSDVEAVPSGTDNTIHDFRSGVDKIDLIQAYVTEAGVEVVKTAQGVELHYVSAYIDAQINLAGVHDISRADIVYNGDVFFV